MELYELYQNIAFHVFAKSPDSTFFFERKFSSLSRPRLPQKPVAIQNLHLAEDYAWTKEDYEVSQMMQDFFANFVKTGDPNGTDLPEWKAVDANAESPRVMVIDTKSEMQQMKNDARYEFLDKQYQP